MSTKGIFAGASISEYLTNVAKKGASDLHINVGKPPVYRIDDELVQGNSPVLTPDQTKDLLFHLLSPDQLKRLEKEKELDFAYCHEDKLRFRANVYYQSGYLSGAFRLIPNEIKTLEQLNLPQVLAKFPEHQQGFVLCVGPMGHGKSTTLASLINMINKNRNDHIVTIEDPIEYVFTPEKCIIDQRELYRDTNSFPRALKSVLREDTDVVMVGEMRDLETMAAAVTLAETGHLVFSTLHTNDAPQAIDRIIDAFPPHQQNQIRMQIANTLLGVISQRLIPRIGGGRIAALEIMMSNAAVRNLIRENKVHQIKSVIQTSAEEDMISMDKSLANLVASGDIQMEDALAFTTDQRNFELLMKD
ncbi:MAG: type IV pilus twitching motility protein PilT [bacterium]